MSYGIIGGSPENTAERILRLHTAMGHSRQFFQIDIGGLPQRDFLHSIEPLGTRVKPLVDAEVGPEPAASPLPPAPSASRVYRALLRLHD